jgi:hypothetical protein
MNGLPLPTCALNSCAQLPLSNVGNWARLLPGRTTCASAELASPKPPFVEMSERFWTPVLIAACRFLLAIRFGERCVAIFGVHRICGFLLIRRKGHFEIFFGSGARQPATGYCMERRAGLAPDHVRRDERVLIHEYLRNWRRRDRRPVGRQTFPCRRERERHRPRRASCGYCGERTVLDRRRRGIRQPRQGERSNFRRWPAGFDHSRHEGASSRRCRSRSARDYGIANRCVDCAERHSLAGKRLHR